MFFGNKRRVEEDLEKIRRANLPPEKSENPPPQEIAPPDDADRAKITAHDLLAMVLAILSLVLPYFLALCGILLVIYFLLGRFFGM